MEIAKKEITILEEIKKRRVMRREEILNMFGKDGVKIASKLSTLGYINIVDLIGNKTFVITKKGAKFLNER